MVHVIDRPLPDTIAGAISTTWTRVAQHAIESRGSNSGELASLGHSGSVVGDEPFDRTQREAVERRVAGLVVVESAEEISKAQPRPRPRRRRRGPSPRGRSPGRRVEDQLIE